MNLDEQLVLGIVFIIAGVAMALLAYAAYLSRQEGKDEEMEGEAELDPPADLESEQEAASLDAAETEAADPPDQAEVAIKPPAPEAKLGPAEVTGPAERAAEPTAAPPTVQRSAAEDRQQDASAVLLRDESTGRLRVDIGDRSYHSIEELRASPDWHNVDHLFSDILAWLVRQQPKVEEPAPVEREPAVDKPLSMVEQINEIINEKLDQREDGPKAVRLVEGATGDVRVYIGMDSYPMEEVPNEEVQAVIRQAVKEWEAQQ